METATEAIIRLLLTYPKKSWKKVELARRANCSKPFLTKLMKKLEEEGIVVKAFSGISLISFSKLINQWIALRELPKPIYIETNLTNKKIEEKLKEMDDYALTLFSAAWHRIKFMKTDSFELYTTKPKQFKKIGEFTRNPTNFLIFYYNKNIFEGMEKIKNINLVSPIQNYVDLMSYGGSGVRVAIRLAEKYDLLGV